MKKFLINSAKKGFYGTLLSRVTGMFRDISLAFFFGGSATLAAFLVAYRFANLFRRLFGEGLLQMGFIPQYEKLRKDSENQGLLFFRDAFFSVVVTASVFIFLGEWLLSYSFWDRQIQFSLQCMLPGLLFLSMYALNSCLLHCHNQFFAPSFAPAISNIAWIVFAFFSYFWGKSSMTFLSVGVVFGFLLQWLFSFFSVQRYFSYPQESFFRPKLFSKEVQKLLSPVGLGIVAIGAGQINSVLDGIFARLVDPSGPAYLWYAIRLQQLPLGLFTVAITSALLPHLSRAISQKQDKTFLDLFLFACKITALFTLFCAFFLFTLGGESINFLFGRGAFSSWDVQNTLYCLWAYVLGLFFMALSLVFNTVYYAKRKYFLPTLFSCFSVGVNVVCNSLFLFIFEFGATSIALATSFASFVQCLFLYAYLEEKPKGFLPFTGKITLIGSCCLLFVTFIQSLFGKGLSVVSSLPLFFPRGFIEQVNDLTAGTCLFIITFGFLCWIGRVKEIGIILPRKGKPLWEE